MSTGRAFFRGFHPFMNISAISASPFNNLIFLKYPVIFNVFKEGKVSFFMTLLDSCYSPDYSRYFAESFLFGNIGKLRI